MSQNLKNKGPYGWACPSLYPWLTHITHHSSILFMAHLFITTPLIDLNYVFRVCLTLWAKLLLFIQGCR